MCAMVLLDMLEDLLWRWYEEHGWNDDASVRCLLPSGYIKGGQGQWRRHGWGS